MAMAPERFLRLVLVPLPFQGHINPMLQLATVLHSRGFSITIIHTQFNSPNPSNHPDFSFNPISEGLSDEIASSENWVSIITTLNINCKEPFQNCLLRIMEQNPHERILCIISDSALYFTQDVANHLKLPRLVLRTNSASAFISITFFPFIQHKDTSSHPLVPELHPLRDNDQQEINIGNGKSFPEMVTNMFEAMKISSGIIWNTFEVIEQTALAEFKGIIPVPNFAIGPLHKLARDSSSSLLMEDKSCITWLDKQAPKSVVYVSFGSLALTDEQELMEIAWGLANSKQPFLWVVRPGLVHGSEWILPEGFFEITSKRGYIVKWAPQQDVLAHPAVGGFWTHCGWNSILESLCEGVPMLCRPCFGDQMSNARYVRDVWRVGLQMEKCLDRLEIEKAIRRVMVDKEGKEMRKQAMDIKEKVDLCLRKGGSSYESLDKLVDCLMSF